MLIEFRFKNYRSFRDEAIMSMEAMGLGSKKDCLIHYKSQKILPTVAIYGKNGGGKSNVIRDISNVIKINNNFTQPISGSANTKGQMTTTSNRPQCRVARSSIS